MVNPKDKQSVWRDELDSERQAEEQAAFAAEQSEAAKQTALTPLMAEAAKLKKQGDNLLPLLFYFVPASIALFKDTLDWLIELVGIGTIFIIHILDIILGFILVASYFVMYNLADKLSDEAVTHQRLLERGGRSILTGILEGIPLVGLLPVQSAYAISEIIEKLGRMSAAQAKLREVQKEIKRIEQS